MRTSSDSCVCFESSTEPLSAAEISIWEAYEGAKRSKTVPLIVGLGVSAYS